MHINGSVTSLARYYRYPQYIWARQLRATLAHLPAAPTATVVDAPCGDGIVSFWLQRWLPDTRLELYDISENCIRIAQTNLPPTVKIIRADVRDIPAEPADDVWLLVNSLYLLPEAEAVLKRLRERMAHVIGIFPRLDHRNYRCYFRRFPHLSNPSAANAKETLRLFQSCGYKSLWLSSSIFIPFHCLALPGLDWFSHRLFNLLDPFFARIAAPCYWLGVFERTKNM